MKTRLCVVVIVAAVGATALAGILVLRAVPKTSTPVRVREMSSPPDAVPIEVIGGSRQDLGMVRKNERRKHTFVIRNASTAEILKITRVKPSCGCLGARQASKDILAPGEEAAIDVEIVGRTTTKRMNDENYINVECENHPPMVITFVYKVTEDVLCSPEEVTLGTTYQRDRLAGSLLLRPLSWGPLKLTTWESEKGIISLDRQEEANGMIRCYYSARPVPPGKYADTLIMHTNAKIDSMIRIPFSWQVEPNLALVPKSIFWGNAVPGETQEKCFLVKSVDDSRFLVQSLQYDDSLFQVEPLFDPTCRVQEAKYRVTLNADRITPGRLLRGSIAINTDVGTVMLTVFGSAFQ